LISGRSREEVAALLERRRPLYARASYTVDASGDPDSVAAQVFALWSK
jgi:hypothetical protein